MRDQKRLAGIAYEVLMETRRQDEKWPWPRDARHLQCFTGDSWMHYGTVYTLADIESEAREELAGGKVTWAGILAEELGEAFNAGTLEAVRAELVQVAAVVVSIIQHIDEAEG